jgi:hypothetical protein
MAELNPDIATEPKQRELRIVLEVGPDHYTYGQPVVSQFEI